jgi:pyruvate dehydrogenase E2 component (dihydrolipoamide acetyltransferase)
MAVEITIPRLGWNMEEGIFLGWLKRDGQHVVAGEPLFSLEGDKATQDVESLETGVVHIPPDGPKDGAKVAVGAVIGYVIGISEAVPPKSRTDVQAETVLNAGPVTIERSAGPHSGRHGSKRRISPRARRAARELAIDPASLVGTGKNGRIVERDVRGLAQVQSTAANATGRDSATRGPRSSGVFEDVPITAIRKTTAERMLLSARTTAGVTIATTVDATNLVNLRQQFKAVVPNSGVPSIGYTDIVIKLTAIVLEKHPMLNATWNGETIRVWRDFHIGIAVDTEAGLFVPVIRDVHSLTLRQVAAQARFLIDRARAGMITAGEMQGSTFTVTNLGPMGIEVFTPLVNPPECAILGLGRIQNQVVVEDKQYVARDRMTLCLTFDHRIVDGAPAARFLQSLGLLIENPSPWLLP